MKMFLLPTIRQESGEFIFQRDFSAHANFLTFIFHKVV